METPEVVRCPDGHFRRVIYSLGPYIADYPEQVLLSGVVTGWCPKLVSSCARLHRTHHILGALRTPGILMEIPSLDLNSGLNTCAPHSVPHSCGMSMALSPMLQSVQPFVPSANPHVSL